MNTALRKKYIGFGLSAVEWYDYAVYSSLAGILGKLFFNFHDPMVNLLYGFITFAFAYIARPVGSSLFGYIAVRTHTDVSIQYTLLLMSIATFGIGLLPTTSLFSYLSVGLLCLFRLLQGIAMGGCYGASYLYVSQTAKPGHKNRSTAFVVMGFMAGFILGNSFTSVLFMFLNENIVLSGGWRLPFLLGGIVSFILFLVCRNTHLLDVPDEKPVCHQKVSWTNHLKHIPTVIKCIAVSGLDMIGFYMFFVFNPNYLTTINFSSSASIANQTTLLMILLAISIWGFSALTDRWNNNKMLLISGVLFIVMGSSFPWVNWWDNVFGIVMLGSCYGSLPNWVIRQFKQNRHLSYYTGMSFSVASVLFAGTTPIFATLLLQQSVQALRLTMICIGVIITTILILNNIFNKMQDNG